MVRGRPEKYPVKKVIGFDQEMLDAIDEWRRQQMPIPTVSDAIRALIENGLANRTAKKSIKTDVDWDHHGSCGALEN